MHPGTAVLLVALVSSVIACSDDAPAGAPSTIDGASATSLGTGNDGAPGFAPDDAVGGETDGSTPVPTASTLPADDGILRLGVLTPLTGDGASIGLSIQASAQMAVTQINAAGGVGGRPVELLVADEGADIAAATTALERLASADVDAIIGPTSSTVTLSLLDAILRDQILACSATATAMSLDAFPDDGLFFRTAPSDSMQAEAIARQIDQTGRSSVGLLYVDDAYGRPFADRVREALTNRSIAITASVPFSPTASADDGRATVASVVDAQVIAVIGAADSGTRMVSAVVDATPQLDTPIIVNDSMRGRTAADAFEGFTDEARSRIIGVAPRAVTENTAFTDALRAVSPDTAGLFAVNAFDCVNLVALAAGAAESSQARQIASRMPSVATSGTRCLAYAECVTELTAGRNVDYDGPSGVLQLAIGGDANRGVFDVFGFDENGTERTVNVITVTL